MVSCKVFFSRLPLVLVSSFSGVGWFFPATNNKTKTTQQQRKKMKRRAIDPKMDDFYLFFLCKRGKSGPNVEDIFFFPSFLVGLWNIFFFPLSRHFPPCPHNLTASKHALANTYNQKRAKSLRVRVYSRINFTSHASRSGSLYLKKRARWKFTKTNKKSFRSHVRRPRSNFTHKGEIDCSRSKAREDT